MTSEGMKKRTMQSKTMGRTWWVFLPIVFGIVALDQVTKAIVRSSLERGVHVPVIPGVVDFELIYNSGAAFGMLQNAKPYFLAMACIITVGAVIYLVKGTQYRTFQVVTLALVVAGAIGNSIDRIVFGKVTDFIAPVFIDFPIFNVADIGVTVGCILFIIAFIVDSGGREEESGAASDVQAVEALATPDAPVASDSPAAPDASETSAAPAPAPSDARPDGERDHG